MSADVFQEGNCPLPSTRRHGLRPSGFRRPRIELTWDKCVRLLASIVPALFAASALGCGKEPGSTASAASGSAAAASARPAAVTNGGQHSARQPAPAQAGKPSTPTARAMPGLPNNAMPDPPEAPAARGVAASADGIRAIFDDYGFRLYPLVTHLCAGRVYKKGGTHLTWDAFSSDDPQQSLIDHYKVWLGERGFSVEAAGGVWRLPPGSAAPTRVLTVQAVSAPGPHERCEHKPASSAKSVLILSRE